MPTNYPLGANPFGNLIVGIQNIYTPGNVFYVKPYTGSDLHDGKTPQFALKTLAEALTRCTADKHDTVVLIAESNTAAYTTDYQSANLDWNKDQVHLIGMAAPAPMSQRSRVAWVSTYAPTTDANLFTLSADGCMISNIQFFAGVDDAQALGCMQITGDRNVVVNCHLAGIGHDTGDVAGAYSLYLSGVQETFFKDCRIGLNTVSAGTAANSEILMASTVKNVIFENCYIYRRIEHATNHPLVKVAAATSLEEFVMFDRCKFISTSTNDAYTQGGVFKFVATPTQGYILLDRPFGYNGTAAAAGKWDVDDLDKIKIVGSPTPAADSACLHRAV